MIKYTLRCANEHEFEAWFNSSAAYDKQVIVVSPTTLLATLRTVQGIWRYEQQNRNAEKIARQAGAIHDQLALVLESLEDVGTQLDRARSAWDRARERMSSGRGNLVRRVQLLRELGARTRKTLPERMTGAAMTEALTDEAGVQDQAGVAAGALDEPPDAGGDHQ